MMNLDFLLLHPREFIQGFSYYYPVPEELLSEYEDVFDWTQLSRNTAIKWNAHLLEKFKYNWKWEYRGLSTNPAMPWSLKLLDQFKDKWSWYHLGWQPPVINDPEMLKMCFQHWNEWHQKNLFTVYSFMPKMEVGASPWAAALFETLPNLNWTLFSAYDGFPWTADFIRKHADKLDWDELSGNSGLPWTITLIREHQHRWNWFSLSYSPIALSSIEMVEAFKDQINWSGFTANTQRKWSTDILINFKDKLCWARTETDEAGYVTHIDGLYNDPSILWNPELYEACNDAIENQFARLAEEEAELFKESGFTLLEEDEHWTVYQNGSNWTEDYMIMLVDITARSPERIVINWVQFGSSFKDWEKWSKETIAFCLERIDLYDLTVNAHFPWHDHPAMFQRLVEFEKDWYGWINLSAQKQLKLTAEMIEQHEGMWDWNLLSGNTTLTLEIIKKYKDRWDWWKVFSSKIFQTELIETYPEQWKLWWRANNNPPFDNREVFANLLHVPTEENLKQHVGVDELKKFLVRITDKSDAVYREDFEKALKEKNFEWLTPSITHDRYYPLLVEYASEIILQQWPNRFVEALAHKAFRLLWQKKFIQSIELFKLCLRMGKKDKISDLSMYCNALYVLQHDNSGLPVNKELNHEFLEICLPFGPKNPAIYFNAACLFMQMSDLDKVYECIQLAKEHKYENYEGMIAEIKNAPMFSAFVSDNRFNDL